MECSIILILGLERATMDGEWEGASGAHTLTVLPVISLFHKVLNVWVHDPNRVIVPITIAYMRTEAAMSSILLNGEFPVNVGVISDE